MAKFRAVRCPSCGSDDVETVQTSGLREFSLALVGMYDFACNRCRRSFRAQPIGIASLFYAKCPRCYRMDLTIWEPRRYRSSSWDRFKLNLGANSWRCDPCRCNFVSFRARKEKYVRPGREETAESGANSAPDSSQIQDA